MRNNKVFPYIILIPFIILFFVFKGLPIVLTVFRSIFDVVNQKYVFIGFYNYTKIFTDIHLYQALLNTLIILIIYLTIKIPLAILLASLLYFMRKRQKIYLFFFYLPTIIGMFAYAILYRYIFTYEGYLNDLLFFLFRIRIDWFSNPIAAQSMIALSLLWASIGFSILIILNAYIAVPKVYIEEAKINGANSFQIVTLILLPKIKSIVSFIILLATIEIIGLIDVPINLTAGNPNGKTVTLGYYIYKQALDFWDFSYASSIGIFLFIVSLACLKIYKGIRNAEIM